MCALLRLFSVYIHLWKSIYLIYAFKFRNVQLIIQSEQLIKQISHFVTRVTVDFDFIGVFRHDVKW